MILKPLTKDKLISNRQIQIIFYFLENTSGEEDLKMQGLE